mgnify:CR=1 FL=1
MPKGIYERDPLDRDHLSSGISFGQETAKLEKEFAELQERKKIRAEIDREYLKSEIYQSRDKIKELQKKGIQLSDELADANYTIKKLQQRESLKCQK